MGRRSRRAGECDPPWTRLGRLSSGGRTGHRHRPGVDAPNQVIEIPGTRAAGNTRRPAGCGCRGGTETRARRCDRGGVARRDTACPAGGTDRCAPAPAPVPCARRPARWKCRSPEPSCEIGCRNLSYWRALGCRSPFVHSRFWVRRPIAVGQIRGVTGKADARLPSPALSLGRGQISLRGRSANGWPAVRQVPSAWSHFQTTFISPHPKEYCCPRARSERSNLMRTAVCLLSGVIGVVLITTRRAVSAMPLPPP